MNPRVQETPPEQVSYANLLFYGSWAAIGILLLTYVVYVSGILDPYVPLDQLTRYWTKPVAHYVHGANIPLGWGWATLLHRGDFLNFIGIVLLAGMTIICYAAVLPAYIKQRDIPYIVIVILEILVLCLGASGIFGAGGH
jgi:hypothetical protein